VHDLDPATTPDVTRSVADVGPLPSFSAAASSVLGYLSSAYGLGLWMVTRTAGEDWIVLSSAGDGPVAAGDVLRWSDGLCSRMVRGLGPRVAPRVAEVPAYADAPVRQVLTIGSYVGVPLTGPTGELFGTLCAVDAAPAHQDLALAQPLFELQARLLSSLISVELLAAEEARRAQVAELRANQDALTALLNRRGWDQALLGEQERARRHASPVSVVALDLDGLKLCNDLRGHNAGDQLLATVGRVLGSAVRHGDVVARTGGDEFAVLCAGTPEPVAQVLATRLQAALQDSGVSVSCGVGGLDPRDGSLAAAWERADRAMYDDKAMRRAGRGPALVR